MEKFEPTGGEVVAPPRLGARVGGDALARARGRHRVHEDARGARDDDGGGGVPRRRRRHRVEVPLEGRSVSVWRRFVARFVGDVGEAATSVRVGGERFDSAVVATDRAGIYLVNVEAKDEAGDEAGDEAKGEDGASFGVAEKIGDYHFGPVTGAAALADGGVATCGADGTPSAAGTSRRARAPGACTRRRPAGVFAGVPAEKWGVDATDFRLAQFGCQRHQARASPGERSASEGGMVAAPDALAIVLVRDPPRRRRGRIRTGAGSSRGDDSTGEAEAVAISFPINLPTPPTFALSCWTCDTPQLLVAGPNATVAVVVPPAKGAVGDPADAWAVKAARRFGRRRWSSRSRRLRRRGVPESLPR